MTDHGGPLHFADAGEAVDLAAFLARLIHYDRAAAVRLQAGGGVLAVFGRPPSFEVLATRTARLAGGGPEAVPVDTTVSAGQLADALDSALSAEAPAIALATRTATGDGGSGGSGGVTVTVPEAVTGPPWARLLPPRGGWERVAGLPGVDAVREAVAVSVAEFRARDVALPEESRTRAERDRIGREIWSRTLGDTGLPLRAVHAAQSLGFLRPVRAGAAADTAGGVTVLDPVAEPLALLAAGGWLRLRTPHGSVAVRTAGPSGLSGLSVTPA